MTIRIYDDLPDQPFRQPSYLTIGNFDGVHLGHQALVEDMTSQAHAAGCLAGLLTFDPHPLAVLRPQAPLAHLTSVGERIELLGAHGLDFVVTLEFTPELAATGAEDFLRELVGRLHLKALWIGPDFALGRGREGNAERLAQIGAMLGFDVHVTNLVDTLGGPVHSSRVRALLGEQGDVASAGALLGRPYQIWGRSNEALGAGMIWDILRPTLLCQITAWFPRSAFTLAGPGWATATAKAILRPSALASAQPSARVSEASRPICSTTTATSTGRTWGLASSNGCAANSASPQPRR